MGLGRISVGMAGIGCTTCRRRRFFVFDEVEAGLDLPNSTLRALTPVVTDLRWIELRRQAVVDHVVEHVAYGKDFLTACGALFRAHNIEEDAVDDADGDGADRRGFPRRCVAEDSEDEGDDDNTDDR